MQFRGGMNEMMRQAARMQRKIEKARDEVKEIELTSTSAGDRIKVTVTYGGRLKALEVDPEFVKAEALDLVLDTITAAVNAGLEQAEKAMDAEFEKRGIKIPGT